MKADETMTGLMMLLAVCAAVYLLTRNDGECREKTERAPIGEFVCGAGQRLEVEGDLFTCRCPAKETKP